LVAEGANFCFQKRAQEGFIMVIFKEYQSLFEMIQVAGKREFNGLVAQMNQNIELFQTLNTPIGKLPKYRFLFDYSPAPVQIGRASLLDIIEFTMKKRPQFESYFIKTPKGLYVGFVAICIALEDGKSVVDGVKTFSFGLENSEDENQMFKDLPGFLDKCLSKYGNISWTAIDGNKANHAYEIYTKRKKGTITKDGKYIRYVCQR
jgi:hypothetical protein